MLQRLESRARSARVLGVLRAVLGALGDLSERWAAKVRPKEEARAYAIWDAAREPITGRLDLATLQQHAARLQQQQPDSAAVALSPEEAEEQHQQRVREALEASRRQTVGDKWREDVRRLGQQLLEIAEELAGHHARGREVRKVEEHKK